MRMKIKHLLILFFVNYSQDAAVASPHILLTQNNAYLNVNHTQTSPNSLNTYINIANAAEFIDANTSIKQYSTSTSDLIAYKMIKFEDKRIIDSDYMKVVLKKNSVIIYNPYSVF